jgi:hypothetical protein
MINPHGAASQKTAFFNFAFVFTFFVQAELSEPVGLALVRPKYTLEV